MRQFKKNGKSFLKALAVYAIAIAFLIPILSVRADASYNAGVGSSTNGNNATAVGDNASGGADRATAFGDSANASNVNSTAIGKDANATHINSVAIGQGSTTSQANSVSFGTSNSRRKLTNVADGAAAADVATWGQVQAVDGKIATNTTNIATNTGNITALSDDLNTEKGKIAANTANIATNTGNITALSDDLNTEKGKIAANTTNIGVLRTDVGDLRTDVGVLRTDVNQNAGEIRNIGNVLGANYRNPTFDTLKVGNITADQNGLAMGGGKITGLADGRIAQGSSEAVTGGQMWNAYQRMGELNDNIQVVGAHAAAMSALHPVPYNPYEPTTLSAGLGLYRNEQSLAVGAFHYVRENLLFNVGASIASDGDVMGRAGVSIAIGKSGKKTPVLARDVTEMQRQLAEVQQVLAELKEENRELREKLNK